MEDTQRPLADYFKSLGDENRLRIVQFLRNGERCVCEIVPLVGTSQSNVSQHLRVLREAGIIDYRRDKKMIKYFVTDPTVFVIIDVLSAALADRNTF